MSTPPFQSVFFDCDSTLSTIEGIDELTRSRPYSVRQEVEALTTAAMEGRLPLEEVYARRLEAIRPTGAELQWLGTRYVETLVPGAREVVAALQSLGKTVGVVSGGLEPAVRALAAHLGLPEEAVEAVPVLLAEDGSGAYAGFDRASPLWRHDGKIAVLSRRRAAAPPLLFVGDGVTDLKAQDAVDLFVGYGGVVPRAAVKAGADVYREDEDLSFVLELGLTPEERARLA